MVKCDNLKRCILIADDEPDVRNLVGASLRNAGFDTAEADNGTAALAKTREQHPALLILDLMMPELSGFDVCKCLKRDPETESIPIIMLSAKADPIDRILGMELGAEDYVIKPFSPRELVLRVQNILRRIPAAPARISELVAGPIKMNLDNHDTRVDGKLVSLTAIEFKLLRTLMEHAGKVRTRGQLLNDVWGYEPTVDGRTVDTHIRRLREKLGSAAASIHTVRSFGYRLEPIPKQITVM